MVSQKCTVFIGPPCICCRMLKILAQLTIRYTYVILTPYFQHGHKFKVDKISTRKESPLVLSHIIYSLTKIAKLF